jgi:beta-glucosidase
LVRPEKELKGFGKVALQPGETKTVRVTLEPRAFAYYHPGFGQWVTESGDFDILVGQSSADLPLSAKVTMTSAQALTRGLHRYSTLREWLADPRGAAVLEPLMQEIMAQLSPELRETMSSEAMEPDKDKPLDVVLASWGKGMLSAPPEDMVAGLLAKVQ